MSAYYNENDPRAAAWLRELIRRGLIAAGEVDERSIVDVAPIELAGFTQCHFFAGIGGWSLALRLAGWSDDRPVWTGSCPCQPFSQAGKGIGFADERHLWPYWFHLLRQRRPIVVFGEQVAASLDWLDLVHDNFEAEDYAFGSVDICGPCAGAPHIRQRLHFVADTADSDRRRRIRSAQAGAGATGERRLGSASGRTDGGMGNSASGHAGGKRQQRSGEFRLQPQSSVAGFWGNSEWIRCTDGKSRPIEPGLKPLVNGLPDRLAMLRGYGNAINPHLAAQFIEAYEAA